MDYSAKCPKPFGCGCSWWQQWRHWAWSRPKVLTSSSSTNCSAANTSVTSSPRSMSLSSRPTKIKVSSDPYQFTRYARAPNGMNGPEIVSTLWISVQQCGAARPNVCTNTSNVVCLERARETIFDVFTGNDLLDRLMGGKKRGLFINHVSTEANGILNCRGCNWCEWYSNWIDVYSVCICCFVDRNLEKYSIMLGFSLTPNSNRLCNIF